MARIEEEIHCEYCDSEFEIAYNENAVDGKLNLCPFCGEHLEEADPDDCEIEER